MKSILDPSFRYTSSAETDLRKTFARIRRELRKREKDAVATNVQPITLGRLQRARRRG
jgi:hypothetical protein